MPLGAARQGGCSYATISLMVPAEHSETSVAAANPFTAADVLAILRERGWLVAEPSVEQRAWCERTALLLGGHAADRAALAELLGLICHCDERRDGPARARIVSSHTAGTGGASWRRGTRPGDLVAGRGRCGFVRGG